MVPKLSQPEQVNVLISDTHWAWPQAVEEIFQPRGVNALLTQSPAEAVRVVGTSKIHLALLDSARDELAAIHTLRLLRKQDALLPCILLAHKLDDHVLREALHLRVFCVLAKPVDIPLLAEQINRLFVRYYNSDLFSESPAGRSSAPAARSAFAAHQTVIQWSVHHKERSNNNGQQN